MSEATTTSERIREQDGPVSRTRSVLFFDPRQSDLRMVNGALLKESTFAYTPNDGEGEEDRSYRPCVILSRDQHDDLGAPAHITVAIWPGDRQDLMESDEFPA